MAELGFVGVLTLVTVLSLAGLTHAVRPLRPLGLPLPAFVRDLTRWLLPTVEIALAVNLAYSALMAESGPYRATLVVVIGLFVVFSVYVDYLRKRRSIELLDCQCTVVQEPASVVGVSRAVAIAAIAAALLAWAPSSAGVKTLWTWIAGACGGILLTYVPTVWNMYLGQLLRLQREHRFSSYVDERA